MAGHILLVCYNFPPNPGIGGRRWAKFAKSLAKSGYTVHVIKARFPPYVQRESNWTDDVRSDFIKIHNLRRLYPTVFTKSDLTIPEKVLYRFFRWTLQFISRGTVYDPTLFWKAQFLKKASSLIRTYNIKNVIATGAPFRLLYYSALLKERFSNINVVCDYRDPWIEPGGGYGINSLSKGKLNQEKYFEEKVYRNADYLIAPSEHVIKPDKYGLDISSKVRIITHAYDPEDIPVSNNETDAGSNKEIKLIYPGRLYEGLDPVLTKLRDALIQLRSSNYKLYSKLSLNFYTPQSRFSSLFNGDLRRMASFHEYASKEKIFKKMNESDICMLFLTEEIKHFMSSKFFELVAVRKPFLLLGPDGDVARFIRNNQLGCCIKSENISSEFCTFISDYEQGSVTYNYNFNQQQYSLERVTDKLKALLI